MAFGRTQADIGNTTAIGQSSALDEFLAELRAYPKLLYTRHCLRMAERAVEPAGAVPSHRLQPRAFDNADEERRSGGYFTGPGWAPTFHEDEQMQSEAID